MSLNLPTFYRRAASSVILVVVVVLGLLWSNISVLVLASAIQMLCLYEFMKLCEKTEKDLRFSPVQVVITQVVGLLWLWLPTFYYVMESPWPAFLFTPALILIITTLGNVHSWKAGVYVLAGLLYIVLPLILMVRIHNIYLNYLPIFIFVLIWTNDTMAYLIGSMIGKTHVSKISPGKTWEGTVGGGIMTIVGGLLIWYIFKFYNITDWIILAVIVSFTAPLGDLLQSQLKRLAGVKDSGNLIPGHGGALDRFDSLLVTLPFTFAYIWFFMPPFQTLKLG